MRCTRPRPGPSPRSAGCSRKRHRNQWSSRRLGSYRHRSQPAAAVKGIQTDGFHAGWDRHRSQPAAVRKCLRTDGLRNGCNCHQGQPAAAGKGRVTYRRWSRRLHAGWDRHRSVTRSQPTAFVKVTDTDGLHTDWDQHQSHTHQEQKGKRSEIRSSLSPGLIAIVAVLVLIAGSLVGVYCCRHCTLQPPSPLPATDNVVQNQAYAVSHSHSCCCWQRRGWSPWSFCALDGHGGGLPGAFGKTSRGCTTKQRCSLTWM